MRWRSGPNALSALEGRFGRLRHRYRFVRSLLGHARTWEFHNSSVKRRRADAGASWPRDHLQEYEEERKRDEDCTGKRPREPLPRTVHSSCAAGLKTQFRWTAIKKCSAPASRARSIA